MQEVWKDIKGYEGSYQVSNLGNVKSVERKDSKGRIAHEKLLRPWDDRNGYLVVHLWKGGTKKHHKVHRLVLETFRPIQGMEKLDCNHIDENKLNNRLDNLNWLTRRDNLYHGTHNRRIAQAHNKPIYCVELDRTFDGIAEAAREFNHSRANIWRVLDKPDRTACGYHWQYARKK